LSLVNVNEIGIFGVRNNEAVSKLNKLVQQLAHERSAFFSQPFSFSWWLRGGEPGSPSDKLSLEGDRGSVKATYIRARFDQDHTPLFHTDKFAVVIDTDHAVKILGRLFESPLFREHFREESDRGMRDIQKETWSFERGSTQYSKTIYEPFPASLEDLRSSVRDLVRLVESKGH